MKKTGIFQGIAKLIWRLVEIVLALMFVLFILGIWRLAKEPVELKYVAPILADVLTPEESDLTVEIDKAYLELALKRGHLLDIKVTNLTVYRPDDTILALIPEGNVSLSILGLIKGDFIPTSLYLEKPYLNILVSEKQEKTPSSASASAVIIDSMTFILNHMVSLDRFVIEKGEFVLDMKSQNTSVLIPEFNFAMEKRSRDELDIQGTTTLYIDGQFTPFWLTGLYNTQNKLLSFEANFKELDVTQLAFALPIFKGLQLNVNGQINGALNLADRQKGLRHIVDNLAFSATLNHAGTIYLPRPLDIYYSVHNMVVKGAFTPHMEQLNMSDSFVDIGGPTAEVASTTTGIGSFLDTNDFSKVQTTFTASVHNVPVISVPDVWPSSLGPDAHAWVKENISGGMVNDAHFVLTLKGEELTSVKGLLDVQDTTVRYMEQMPIVEHAYGKVILQLGRVDIEATQGVSGNLILDRALLNLTQLLGDDPIAHMEIAAHGPLNEALSLINQPPLYFADEFQINPKTVQGSGSADLILDFPLDENVELKDVHVSVTADLKEVQMPVMDTPFTLDNGTLKLTASNDGLTIAGTALLNGQFESLLSCSQSFLSKRSYDSKCHVQTSILGADLVTFSEELPDFIAGPLDIDLTVIQKNKHETELNLKADMTRATLNLWPISYIKNPKDPSVLTGTFLLKNNTLTDIPNIAFTAEKDQVQIKGKASFKNGTFFHFDTIKAPRNDASVLFKRDQNDLVTFEVKGKALNLTEAAHGRRLNEPKTPEEVAEEQARRIRSFTGTVQLDKLYLSPLTPLTNVQVLLAKENDVWQKIDAVAFADSDDIRFQLDKNKKELIASSDNIGKILKQAGYTSRIQGGTLKSTITQDAKGTLSGTIHIQKYQLTGATFLMKAATILGILDAFTGDTIDFKKATIPFTLSPENVLTIKDAIASGTTLGITLNGTLTYDQMNFKGSVIPAYAINSLPGKIPLIGRLFSGDKGGGLFGVSFEATGSPGEPNVSFNPTSILTPGIIRNIFN